MAYIKKIWKDYPDTTTPILASDLENIEKGIYELTTGWISADETWTYSSVDNPTGVITITGDKTTKYSLGMRIKFTNNSNVIYGIITKISYSSPNTILTFLHEINPSTSLALHLIANSAITNNYYSAMKIPYSFPNTKNKWSINFTDTNNRFQSNPVSGTWYNLNSNKIILPIGCWDIALVLNVYVDRETAGLCNVVSTLSTSATSETDTNFSSVLQFGPVSAMVSPAIKTKALIISTKTNYYLNVKTNQASMLTIGLIANSAITAVCAYL